MKYYFVSVDGDHIVEEENYRGCYSGGPDMFTVKLKAEAEAKRRIKNRIKELEEALRKLK